METPYCNFGNTFSSEEETCLREEFKERCFLKNLTGLLLHSGVKCRCYLIGQKIWRTLFHYTSVSMRVISFSKLHWATKNISQFKKFVTDVSSVISLSYFLC